MQERAALSDLCSPLHMHTVEVTHICTLFTNTEKNGRVGEMEEEFFYMCVYSCFCAQVHVHKPVYIGEQQLISSVFFNCLLPYVLRQDL